MDNFFKEMNTVSELKQNYTQTNCFTIRGAGFFITVATEDLNEAIAAFCEISGCENSGIEKIEKSDEIYIRCNYSK